MPRHANHQWVALLLLLFVGRPVAASQDDKPKTVAVSLVFVTQVNIASVAVMDEKSPGRDAVVAWVKPVIAAVETQFAKDKARRTVVVQVTLHPDRAAEVVVAGRPAATDAEIKAILKVAEAAKLPRSRIADCVLQIVAEVNGGDPNKDKPFSPPLSTPSERRLTEFRTASTSAKLATMKRWARSEAVPLIGQFAAEADPKFEGVVNLGKALKGVKPEGPVDVAALTDKNPDYWRAMMEMAPGLPLIVSTRVSLLAANGQIDAARRMTQTLAVFDGHKSGYSAVLAEFKAMSDVFYKDIEARIRKGIALHDAGKFNEALAVYEGILKDYPDSAWCHYERHQTLLAKAMKNEVQALPSWADTRKAILQADPLYPSIAEVTSEDELYDMLLRKATEELFKDKTKTVQDLLSYADIALDLGQPGIAAVIYWNLLSSVKPEDYKKRDLIEAVLYCIEKLGADQLKRNFKGDHAAAFALIDAERAKRRKESAATGVMKEKSK